VSGSAQVTAYDSAQVRVSGSAQVTASKCVAVTVTPSRYDGRTPKVTGGVVINVPKIKTVEEWCEYHGVKVSRGNAILFKAVDNDLRSYYGFEYPIGKRVEAPDWDGGVQECGGGLHFSPQAHATRKFASEQEAPKLLACRVRLVDIVIHPDGSYPQKCKAKGCTPLHEVDEDGVKLA
jgi:hypothetical protein